MQPSSSLLPSFLGYILLALPGNGSFLPYSWITLFLSPQPSALWLSSSSLAGELAFPMVPSNEKYQHYMIPQLKIGNKEKNQCCIPVHPLQRVPQLEISQYLPQMTVLVVAVVAAEM